jgi:hypothetical protein
VHAGCHRAELLREGFHSSQLASMANNDQSTQSLAALEARFLQQLASSQVKEPIRQRLCSCLTAKHLHAFCHHVETLLRARACDAQTFTSHELRGTMTKSRSSSSTSRPRPLLRFQLASNSS